LLMMAEAVTLMKKQRDSAASALASIVLPAVVQGQGSSRCVRCT
jgi:hypothetical protein